METKLSQIIRFILLTKLSYFLDSKDKKKTIREQEDKKLHYQETYCRRASKAGVKGVELKW
jgi:hypothetical protein